MLRQIRHMLPALGNQPRQSGRLRRGFTVVLMVILAGLQFWQPVMAYLPAGYDEFDSSATIRIDLSMSGGPVVPATVVGTTMVKRSTPYDPGDGHMTIDTEILSFSLDGLSALGPITLR